MRDARSLENSVVSSSSLQHISGRTFPAGVDTGRRLLGQGPLDLFEDHLVFGFGHGDPGQADSPVIGSIEPDFDQLYPRSWLRHHKSINHRGLLFLLGVRESLDAGLGVHTGF